jgi:PPK2 family polyphosphate:nucleotide phosphotransferase
MSKRSGGKRITGDDLVRECRLKPGKHAHLSDKDAGRTHGWEKEGALEALEANRERLRELQYQLYADGRYAVLAVLQAIDGGGKDGTVRGVFTAFNPQGCTVTSFKAPSTEELKHDYLWRVHRHVPPRGEVGVFNRSHYEDVLVVRVDNLAPRETWRARYDQINNFERMLSENRVVVVKFFLHISKDEQRKRFEERINDPTKQWKFSLEDLEKRKQWKDYKAAFEDALTRCSTPWAPWYVIPADRNWFRNLAVSQVMVTELEKLSLEFPKPKFDPARIRVR